MKSVFERIISFLSNPTYGSIFSGIVFFLIIYFNSKDWKYSLQFTIFVAGMYLFNFFVCNYYRDLKANHFNFRAAATPRSWLYFGLYVGGTIIVFLIFLPKIFL